MKAYSAGSNTKGHRHQNTIMDDFNGQEHPTPECPVCRSNMTRPIDKSVATCFKCDNTWFYDEDYSEHFEFNE
jgi:ribosomal protein L37AE/L43A